MFAIVPKISQSSSIALFGSLLGGVWWTDDDMLAMLLSAPVSSKRKIS